MNIRCVLFATWLLLFSASGGAAPHEWKVPIQERMLANGLRVVVSRDESAPVFGLCVTYGVGFRLEPEGSSGYAHLFEHMMFEGTPGAPKGVFDRVIENGGGSDNADTRFDFTEYFETAPVSALDPVLWLEADRMKGLDLSQKNLDNQREVVEEEIRTNFLNQPYGQFYWLDLPQKAFDKFPDSHNFLGDFSDLGRATPETIERFFREYYAPNNAVLSVVGDVEPAEVFARAQRYFGAIPRRKLSARPDISESPQKTERRVTEYDKLAREPAPAVGYRVPPHNAPDAMAGAVVGQILHGGHASRLYQHDGRGQIGATIGSGDVGDEGPVDFQYVNGQLFEVGEGGEPRTEIVDGDAQSERLERPKIADRGPEVTHQGTFGDLEDQVRRLESGLEQRETDTIANRAVRNFARREIDTHQEVGRSDPLTLPTASLGARLGEHEPVDVVDEADLFGEGDERDRLKKSTRRMLPAHERLETHDRTGDQVEDRLVVDAQLLGQHRSSHVVLELETLHDRDMHLVPELLDAVLTLLLRQVHREVGVAQELIAGVTRQTESDADTHRRGDFLSRHVDRLTKALHETIGHIHDLVAVGRVFDQHREFVTAQARAGVRFTKAAGDRRGDDSQQF